MINSIVCAKQIIRAVISKSSVPEDPIHAENVHEWLLRLKADADETLQIAALAHDIDRADETRKIQRADYDDYNEFKAAHSRNSAKILKEVLHECQLEQPIIDEACRLVEQHEIGGDSRSDLLKDVDSLSFFEVNMPLYFQREGYEETLRRCIWGYRRLSPQTKKICRNMLIHKLCSINC
jgi:hypothetical protein|tara:strand:+ start:1231 stop:1770 length:540 start_codon:yes stop_codon:yes gene_type:complete